MKKYIFVQRAFHRLHDACVFVPLCIIRIAKSRNLHFCPECLPQAARVREAELSFEPDQKPAEAEIQIARFLTKDEYSNDIGDQCTYISKIHLGIEVAIEDRVDIL